MLAVFVLLSPSFAETPAEPEDPTEPETPTEPDVPAPAFTAYTETVRKSTMVQEDFAKLPRHVAIIMDGNGRWAKQHKIQVALGHRRGVEALRAIIQESNDLKIEALSLYAFSTENWKRSPQEVEALMGLMLEFCLAEIDEMDEET